MSAQGSYLEHRVKICGITRFEDARLCAELGAWAVGFIFVSESPRYLSLSSASELMNQFSKFQTSLKKASATALTASTPVPVSRLQTYPLKIGVFRNVSLKELIEADQLLGLDGFQLHGTETPSFCSEIKKHLPQKLLIKALSPRLESDLTAIFKYEDYCDFILIDSFASEKTGGTGKLARWDWIEKLESRLPLIVAGGINSGNANAAFTRMKPFALDLSSSLESSPGIKDEKKLKSFFETLQSNIL